MGVIASILLAFVSVAVAILVSVTSRLLAEDVKAWRPKLTDWLISRAVLRLPADQRERLNEEWRSHVNETPGGLTKVWCAIGYSRAARTVSELVLPKASG